LPCSPAAPASISHASVFALDPIGWSSGRRGSKVSHDSTAFDPSIASVAVWLAGPSAPTAPESAVRFQLLRAQACGEAGEPFVALSRITEALALAEPGVALETRTLLVFLTHYALEAGQFNLARRTSDQLESAERWAAVLGEPPLEPAAFRHWLHARLDAVEGNTARAIATFQRLLGEMERDPGLQGDAGALSLDLAAVLDATGQEEAALTVLWIARLRGRLTQTQGKVEETGTQLLHRARTSLLGRALKDRPPPNSLRALGG
jgi:hypothetical protein